MALIQRSNAQTEAKEELAVDQVLEMDEKTWYERAYRGEDAPQLTVRALAMGSLLGFFLAFTNLYIGLKTGWHLGVAILPSPTGVGLGSMFLGAALAAGAHALLKERAERYTVPISSGLIAGESIVGVIVAIIDNFILK